MGSIAFFGKMPLAADFVRRGVSGPVMRGFENWFHDAYTELRGAGVRGLDHRCCMILPHRNEASGVVAVLAVPSRDRIGRQFPVVVATFVSHEALPPGFASLILGFAPFWESAASIIESNREGEPDAMWEALQVLTPPDANELAAAHERSSELLANLGARQMEQDCFSDSDERFYAYHTLRLAVRDAPENRSLMCPAAGNPGYRAFWVEAIERATSHGVQLPIAWLNGPEAPKGTLVALGKAPTAVLRYLTGHGRQSNTLWPLTTENAAARERSKEALSGQEWSDTEQKLSRLIDVVLSTEL